MSMTLFARADIQTVAVSPAHGGCGESHSRPEVNGKPVRVWRLECEKCEYHLSGRSQPKVWRYVLNDRGVVTNQEQVHPGDPSWSTSEDDLPLTPGAAKDLEKRRAGGRDARNASFTRALESLAGSQVTDSVGSVLRNLAPLPVSAQVSYCPAGHVNSGAVKYCGDCGKAVKGGRK